MKFKMAKWPLSFLIVEKLIHSFGKIIKTKGFVFQNIVAYWFLRIGICFFIHFVWFLHELACLSSPICIVCIVHFINFYSTTLWEYDNEESLVKWPFIVCLWASLKKVVSHQSRLLLFSLWMGLHKRFWNRFVLRSKYSDLIIHIYTFFFLFVDNVLLRVLNMR